jgi:dTDP-L-rhamnose 4-epimerase
MRILVTGGAGFIGSHLVDVLIKEGHQVRVYDNLEPQTHKGGKLPKYFNKKAEFVKGDVRNKEEFSKALKSIDLVFHLAAAVGSSTAGKNYFFYLIFSVS